MDEEPTIELIAYTPEELWEHPRDSFESLDSERLIHTAPATIAQFLDRISVDECRAFLRQLTTKRAGEVLSEMDEEVAADVLSAMREKRALRILDDFEPDDAADIVAELSHDAKERLFHKLELKTRKEIEALLAYDPDSAGGIMTTQVDTAYDDMTVDEAIQRIRGFAEKHEDLHYVYVVDRKRMIKGIISLRKLIQAKPEQMVSTIMETKIRGVVSPEMDKEAVALLMADLNLPDIAVVHETGRLLGVITHDDVLDVIRDEATEDFQLMSGAGGDETIHDKISYSILKRQPWLGVNLLTAFLATGAIYLFQEDIAKMPILAAIMPIIATVGGNSGQQSLAVAIRSIALGQLNRGDERNILLKQAAIGLVNGAVIGILGALLIILFGGSLMLGVVVLGSMLMNMCLAGVTGAFIPILLLRLNRDPAQSSSILLTTVTDTGGFFIFLFLGTTLIPIA